MPHFRLYPIFYCAPFFGKKGYNRKWGTVESRQPILLVFSGYNRKGGYNRKWGTIKRGHNQKWGTIENTLYLVKDKPHVLNRYFSRSVLIFESFTLQECTRLTKEQKRIDFNWIFYIGNLFLTTLEKLNVSI